MADHPLTPEQLDDILKMSQMTLKEAFTVLNRIADSLERIAAVQELQLQSYEAEAEEVRKHNAEVLRRYRTAVCRRSVSDGKA